MDQSCRSDRSDRSDRRDQSDRSDRRVSELSEWIGEGRSYRSGVGAIGAIRERSLALIQRAGGHIGPPLRRSRLVLTGTDAQIVRPYTAQ